MLISWVVVTVSYWLDLPDLHWYLAILVLIIILYRYKYNYQLFYPVSSYQELIILTAGFAFISYIVYITKYSLIFTLWDSVVSWNRWAIELFQNKYNPFNAAYPILFPGLWSLIYKGQGRSDIWITAKFSMFILPYMMALIPAIFIDKKFWTTLYIISVIIVFITKYINHSLTGYMDAPVAFIIFITAMLMIAVSELFENDNRKKINDLLNMISVFAGLASITKQPGFLMLFLVTFWYILLLIRKNISRKEFVLNLIIMYLPITTFLSIFFWNRTSIVGNLDNLRELVEHKNNKLGIIYNAFLHMKFAAGGYLLLGYLGLPSIANALFIKKLSAITGIIFLIGAVVGFFIFADCCSYDQRNGWWIVFLLSAGSISAIYTMEKSRQNITEIKIPVIAVIMLIGTGLTFVGRYFFSDNKLSSVQNALQWKLGYVDANNLLKENRYRLNNQAVFITPYQYAQWLPDELIRSKYRLCHPGGEKCVYEKLEKNPGSYILMQKKGAHVYPQVLKKIHNKGKKIGGKGTWELYGPLDSDDLK